ncbi:testis-expressed protein 52 [Pelodytes ibericus]
MLCYPPPAPLLPDPPDYSIGFTSRGIHRLIHRTPPCTVAKLELMRKQRSPHGEDIPPPPTAGYLTWLEVSRLPPLLPSRPDKPYDSAVWRQLTAALTRPSGVGPIPPPSRMEENTWGKFVHCRGIRGDEREARSLLMRSLARVPPTDSQGNILPPQGFIRYPVRSSGAASVAPPKSGILRIPPYPRTSSKLTPHRSQAHYSEILRRYQELQGHSRTIVPYNSRMPTPRAGSQKVKG